MFTDFCYSRQCKQALKTVDLVIIDEGEFIRCNATSNKLNKCLPE